MNIKKMKKKLKKLKKKIKKAEYKCIQSKKSAWQRFWENEDNCFG